jgi:hypothetical protein
MIAIASKARVCRTISAIDLPPNSIIDLSDVVTPSPAMANTKNHCETSARKLERIVGINPLLLTINHKANPRANQGKALGLIVPSSSSPFNKSAIMITMNGSIEILSNLIKVATSPVSFDTAYPAPTT